MAYFTRDDSGTLAAIVIARRVRSSVEFATMRANLVAHLSEIMCRARNMVPEEGVAYLRSLGGKTRILETELDRIVGDLPNVPNSTPSGSALWSRHNLKSELRTELTEIRVEVDCQAGSR